MAVLRRQIRVKGVVQTEREDRTDTSLSTWVRGHVEKKMGSWTHAPLEENWRWALTENTQTHEASVCDVFQEASADGISVPLWKHVL